MLCYGKTVVVIQSIMSNSLWPHGLQHARLPCPSLSPRVDSTPCSLIRGCHPTILSSVSHLILCHPLLLPPSIFPSIRLFSNESALHIKWPKYWSFNFSIRPSNEISGSVFFRIDWSDLLSVQGTLKILLQHRSSKASVLWHSAFFMIQLSHPYVTTGKTVALTVWTLVGKVMSQLFNMLSRFVITFLPRRKHLLMLWEDSRQLFPYYRTWNAWFKVGKLGIRYRKGSEFYMKNLGLLRMLFFWKRLFGKVLRCNKMPDVWEIT